MLQQGEVNCQQMRQDFGSLLGLWKSVYYSEEKKDECH